MAIHSIRTDGKTLTIERDRLPRLIAGLVAIGFGSIWTAAALWTAYEEYQKEPTGLPIVLAIVFGGFGTVIALVGFALTLYRSGVQIDRQSGLVYTYSRLLRYRRQRRGELREFSSVTITRHEARRSREGKKVAYPVSLTGSSHQVHTLTFATYQRARQFAEQLAKQLQMGICDETTGAPVYREAGYLDESLADRLVRNGRLGDLPSPPTDTEISVDVQEGQITLTIPQLGLRPIHVIVVGIVTGLGLLIGGGTLLFAWLAEGQVGSDLLIMAAVFVLIPFLSTSAILLKLILSEVWITIAPEWLRIEKRGFGIGRASQFAAADLEELVISRGNSTEPQSILLGLGPSVLVRTDHASVEFGRGLTGRELHWITELIKHVLAARTVRTH